MKLICLLPAAMLVLCSLACNQPAKDVALADTLKDRKQFYKAKEGVSTDFLQLNSNATDSSATASPPPPQRPRQDQSKQDWDKKIIKTATLSVEVKSHKAFSDQLRVNVKQLGGYIAQEEQNQSDDKLESILTIKVPVDQFENAVSQLTPSTEKLVEKKITSEDVTTEVVDTKARMEAKKRFRDRYLDLLKQAKNMEEILAVQNEINQVQEEIESGTGRIEYLGHAAAFSTINLTFSQVLNPSAVTKTDPGYGSRIVGSFRSGLNWFGELFVLLVSLWPLWIGLIIVLAIIKRYRPAFNRPPNNP